MHYQTLEPSSLSSLGVGAPSFEGTTASFLATSSFIYTLFFVAIVGAAFYRYAIAGGLRMQANENSIRQSNEIIKKATLGLLGVFSLFLILFTVNKGLVTGDVGLAGFGRNTSGSPVSTGAPQSTAGTPASGVPTAGCEQTSIVLSKLNSSSGVCGGSVCTVLSGCNYAPYLAIIEKEAGGDTLLKKLAIVTMCRESRANPNASNKNPDNSYDCGLMQINKKLGGSCTAEDLAPALNIQKGVQLLKGKMSLASQTIPGVPAEANIFSSYNCCSNGTNPVAPSADCTPANGFPANFPKWACPINPGAGTFNMCTVKNYACELSACLDKL